jgi:sugar lactone lactonase YvrE
VAVAVLFVMAVPAQAAPAVPLRSGQIMVVAGRGVAGFSGDGGPAREALIVADRISVGRDGSVYLSDAERVRRVRPDGVIDTVFSARSSLRDLEKEKVAGSAVGPDGSLYVTSEYDYERQLLRVGRNGAVTVLADESQLGAANNLDVAESDDIAVDGAGNAFLYDATHKRVVRVDPSGGVTRVGGGGIDLNAPQLAVGPNGVVYLTDDDDVDGASDPGGEVYALGAAGPRRVVASTDEGELSGPAVAADGTVYCIDESRRQIMRIDKAGTLVPVSVRLEGIRDELAVGPDGDLYVTHGDPVGDISRILRLVRHGEDIPNPDVPEKPGRWARAGDAPGTVHTVAGTGKRPPAAREPSEATIEQEENVGGVAVDGAGMVYVAEPVRNQVRAIASDGTVRRFAGTGAAGETTGDYVDKKADTVVLNRPTGVAAAPDGTVYLIANHGLYRVDPAGNISKIDVPVQADGANLDMPTSVATDAAGRLYYADYDTIQKLGPDGRAVVVAGATPETSTEENRPALSHLLSEPRLLSVGADGSVYFVQQYSNAVHVARPNGALDTAVGEATAGFAGDGGPATRGRTNNPFGGAVGRDGSRYIADTYNNRVRRIDARGVITTVAGSGRYGDTGDGGPATKAALVEPTGVDVGPDGTLFVLTSSDRVRAIEPNGTIRTLADLDPEPVRRATETSFARLDSFAVGLDGTVYLAGASGVYSTTSDGEMRPVDFDIPLSTLYEYGRPQAASLAVGPDGSLHAVPNALVRAYPDGAVVPLLGGGMENRVADQPPEKWSTPVEYGFREGDPRDVEIGPDGTVYLSTDHGIYSWSPDGKLDTVLKAGEYDYFRGLALDPNGRLHLVDGNGVARVVDGKAEPVEDLYHSDDVAVASDGTMFVSTGREIRRFSSGGAGETVYRSDNSGVTQLVVGPNDDLYFLEPNAKQVRVLVEPTQAPELSMSRSRSTIPGTVLLGIGGGIIVLIGAAIVIRRIRSGEVATDASRGRSEEGPDVASGDGADRQDG